MIFTSLRTNKEYKIVPDVHFRGAWNDKGEYFPRKCVTYKILLDGVQVQHAFDFQGIYDSIRFYECPPKDDHMSSRFD